jgi:nitroreductase
VLTGAVKERVSAAILATYENPARLAEQDEPYDYYPTEWVSPYVDRRRKVGWDLYSLLGIAKGDKPRMHAQHARNYRFFDAPVGLIFTIDRVMQQGSFLDYGMFLQSLMVAARARGLDTCPQAAFTTFHRIIAKEIGLADSQRLVCGMSLGYADPSRIENALVSERAPVSDFTHFHDHNPAEASS